MQRNVAFQGVLSLFGAIFLVIWPNFAVSEQLNVFAAASLREAVAEMAEQFQGDHDMEVVVASGGSASLARQVAAGAPADLVLLADEDWARWLVAQGVAQGGAPFAGNRLAVIGQAGSAKIEAPGDMTERLGQGALAMGQIETVPAGRYGKAALSYFGIWESLAPQVVQASNVRAALRFVQMGEAQLGIGYASDVIANDGLEILYEFPPESHPPILYTAVPITPNGALFEAFARGQAGQNILTQWGFLPLLQEDDLND